MGLDEFQLKKALALWVAIVKYYWSLKQERNKT